MREESGALVSKLVRIDAPIARIPNLAIHLTAGAEREHFAPNLQEHAKAILTMDPDSIKFKFEGSEEDTSTSARLHPFLVKLISDAASVSQCIIHTLALADNKMLVLFMTNMTIFFPMAVIISCH